VYLLSRVLFVRLLEAQFHYNASDGFEKPVDFISAFRPIAKDSITTETTAEIDKSVIGIIEVFTISQHA
jgi:hypothetical protein